MFNLGLYYCVSYFSPSWVMSSTLSQALQSITIGAQRRRLKEEGGGEGFRYFSIIDCLYRFTPTESISECRFRSLVW